jgi:hypothetical protein
MIRGDLARAGEAYEEARRLAESLDDMKGLVGALNDLGSVALGRGAGREAIQLHGRAVSLAQQFGETDLLIAGLASLGRQNIKRGGLRRQAGAINRRWISFSGQQTSVPKRCSGIISD